MQQTHRCSHTSASTGPPQEAAWEGEQPGLARTRAQRPPAFGSQHQL